jgi:hypothetical protein
MPHGTIEGLAKLSKLEHLVTESEAKPIRGLDSLTQLRWLSLGMGTLTKGIAEQVLRLPHLSRLDLILRAVEAGALAALAKAPSLRLLTVTTTNGDTPLAELARLEQLRYLWIRNLDQAQPDLHSLQTALPACRVVPGSPDVDDDDYDWS